MKSGVIVVLDSMRKPTDDYKEAVEVLNEYVMSFHLKYLMLAVPAPSSTQPHYTHTGLR